MQGLCQVLPLACRKDQFISLVDSAAVAEVFHIRWRFSVWSAGHGEKVRDAGKVHLRRPRCFDYGRLICKSA